MELKHCLICGKLAKIYTGHVVGEGGYPHFDGKKITAGWCIMHIPCKNNLAERLLCKKDGISFRKGYFGRWSFDKNEII